MLIERVGFGVVEPNHLSAQGNRQIYAQLPCKEDIKILENGQFVKYDYASGEVNFTGEGEWMLVFNEVKLYDPRQQRLKDFAMIEENYTEGSDITHEGIGPFKGRMTPRVFKTNIGDIFTTNAVGGPNTSNTAKTEGVELVVGDKLSPNAATGFLSKSGDGSIEWKVVKTYTMPDGQPGVKLQRVK